MELTDIARVPDVRSALVCDPAGALLSSVREHDGESAAAVTGFLVSTLGQIGDELGLGPFQRMSVAGQGRATLVLALRSTILAAVIEPAAALPAAEQAIDTLLQR